MSGLASASGNTALAAWAADCDVTRANEIVDTPEETGTEGLISQAHVQARAFYLSAPYRATG